MTTNKGCEGQSTDVSLKNSSMMMTIKDEVRIGRTGRDALVATPEDEKRAADENDGSTPQSQEIQDIEYRYMTFSTAVPAKPVLAPSPSPSSDKTDNQHELPECPDLKQYDDPFTWPVARKNRMTYLACSVNITAAYAAGSYAAPAFVLTEKWGVSNVVYNLGITVFTMGFGIAPMVLAPFSEINGRRPVFIATGLLFVVCQLGCALTESFGGMLAARFFLGVGGSTFATMVGGILADIWVTADRNRPMVLFSACTLFGTGLGPLVSGAVAQNLLWRWVFYVQIITSGTLVALLTAFFKETRGSIILSRKAKAVNKWYERLEAAGAIGMEVVDDTNTEKVGAVPEEGARGGGAGRGEEKARRSSTTRRPVYHTRRIRFKVKADEERTSLGRMIALSLYRPMHMLLTEPVVFWFSLWISFSWAVLYLQFGSIPLVFRVNHGFSLQQTGAVFSAMCIGGILSAVVGIYGEQWATRRYPDKFNSGNPEGRLLFTCIQAGLMPIGMFWFGWTCTPNIHWIVPTVALAVVTMGIFSIYLAVFNYSADVYHSYASSALAASGLCRNLLCGCFPLLDVQMFTNLGFQRASSVLGGIGAALTLVPWVLVFYGPKIRARSKIASAFVERVE